MKRRRTVLALVLILIALPAVWALIEAVSFHVRNRTNGSMYSSGKRRYLLYVPPGYDGSKPVPLVISMHGVGGWPTQQMEISEWNRVAAREGFLVVYPAADGFPRAWGPGDQRYIADLIDELQGKYNLDPGRIYANGLSNGGGMAFVLSCTLSDRIAAVGMVAAAQTVPWIWCRDRRAVPMIAFHGTADPVTPYHGGATWISTRPFPDIPGWTAKWAKRNGCAPDAVESAAARDVIRREYKSCADGADVVLYTVRDGGHTWPGGGPLPEWFVGPNTRSVDASSEMWAFFRAHPLRRK